MLALFAYCYGFMEDVQAHAYFLVNLLHKNTNTTQNTPLYKITPLEGNDLRSGMPWSIAYRPRVDIIQDDGRCSIISQSQVNNHSTNLFLCTKGRGARSILAMNFVVTAMSPLLRL